MNELIFIETIEFRDLQAPLEIWVGVRLFNSGSSILTASRMVQ